MKKISLTALVGACLLAGCSLAGGEGASDKAGGSDAPVVLRLAYPYKPREGQPDEPALRYFAGRVAALSDGGMRVRISFGVGGEHVVEKEAAVASRVRGGEYDLGWIATRVWDTLGVKSFQALQAPFLITDHGLLGRVAQSPLADDMLAGLRPLDLAGLAVVPELLRHPAARRHALVSVEDFHGARIRDIPSAATDALLSALGAKPVHVANDRFGSEVALGHIDGVELPTPRVLGGWTVTANVTFFGKANTVVANTEALDGLTGDQRDVLMRAAAQTVGYAVEKAPSERALSHRFCPAGRIVIASPSQLAGLRRAARPVYEQLERDAGTRALMAAIRDMKRSQPSPPPSVPCGRAGQPKQAAQPAPSADMFDGTYRWHLTAEGARRAGTPGDPDIGSVVTMTLRGGRWLLGTDAHYSGSFETKGNRLIFDWPSEGSVLTFTFKRGQDGALDVKPVLPMDPGDQFVWASGPWRRVGPPVRDVP
jgi:TRAP-type C4-dicarboxylate transport system substrate-binding protein